MPCNVDALFKAVNVVFGEPQNGTLWFRGTRRTWFSWLGIRDGVLALDHYSETDAPVTSVNVSLDAISWIYDGAPHNISWHIGWSPFRYLFGLMEQDRYFAQCCYHSEGL